MRGGERSNDSPHDVTCRQTTTLAQRGLQPAGAPLQKATVCSAVARPTRTKSNKFYSERAEAHNVQIVRARASSPVGRDLHRGTRSRDISRHGAAAGAGFSLVGHSHIDRRHRRFTAIALHRRARVKRGVEHDRDGPCEKAATCRHDDEPHSSDGARDSCIDLRGLHSCPARGTGDDRRHAPSVVRAASVRLDVPDRRHTVGHERRGHEVWSPPLVHLRDRAPRIVVQQEQAVGDGQRELRRRIWAHAAHVRVPQGGHLP